MAPDSTRLVSGDATKRAALHSGIMDMHWVLPWVQLAQVFGTASAVVTILALIVGGAIGLQRYRRDLRLKAADLVLRMEAEYREVLPICLILETLPRYEQILKPVLDKEASGGELVGSELELIRQLDRCLRFFFVCTLLHADLKVEETAIARAYYYYVCVLAEHGRRTELAGYVQRYYKRLDQWMKIHEPCLDHYRDRGEWQKRLARKL